MQSDILSALEGTEFGFLKSMVEAFYHGSVTEFHALLDDHRDAFDSLVSTFSPLFSPSVPPQLLTYPFTHACWLYVCSLSLSLACLSGKLGHDQGEDLPALPPSTHLHEATSPTGAFLPGDPGTPVLGAGRGGGVDRHASSVPRLDPRHYRRGGAASVCVLHSGLA